MADVTYPDTNGHSKVRETRRRPIADNIKSEASRTGQEFRELKNARFTPSSTTATGQPLTYYHSLLYSLLSWEQPRATAASFASVITFIFAARYLPLLRWFFKFIYVVLGFTAVAEVGGRLVLSQSVVSSFRPRKYYTVPKETIEAVLEDLEQLIDFILIEFQRVLFAENIVHTIASFFAAFAAYWLIKFLPFWGLSLIAVTIAYMGPLVYINNREVIDAHIEHAQGVVNAQAHQLKGLAEERTAHATGVVRQYVDDYSAKAQGYMRRSASPEMAKVSSPVIKKEPETEPEIKTTDFPEAPKDEPKEVPVLDTPKAEPVESIEQAVQNVETEPLLAA
ncbi:reticulon-like protein 1 Cwl1 [Aspergillus heteromorphus CBS 117.55]|uniref:Reticulon-like protein n=1 Tax=Aspergillus heteromorphus CBS 117.55 TaxID=1448321 RepID=A0A317WSK3_9EURO|nr:reticulon-like protein 1 Cwl1 [Aspergillus heteromorphus CBS 117.55]PWY88312.1 reticulon-like protein 1 Cwl1 [Aspergillus heteromorphus CBS 117.55]